MLFFFACLSKHVTYITLNAAPLLTVQVRYISNLEQKWYRGLLSSLSFTPPPRADFFFNFQTWFQKHLWKHISSSVLFFLNSNFGAYCSYILPQLKTAIAVIFFPCCHLFFSPTHAWSERVPTWPPTLLLTFYRNISSQLHQEIDYRAGYINPHVWRWVTGFSWLLECFFARSLPVDSPSQRVHILNEDEGWSIWLRHAIWAIYVLNWDMLMRFDW